MKRALPLIIALTALLVCLCAACTPAAERVYSVGDTWSDGSVAYG